MKNKIRHIIAIALAAVTLFSSCSKDEPTIILSPDELFNAKEIVFEGLAGNQSHTIEFESPKAWTAEIHSIGSWLKADVQYGEAGHSTITISPRSDNFGVTAREAELEIYIDGYEAYSIKVYQESAATGDIKVNGHIDAGIMTLTANDTGTEFEDTIWVKSSKKWTLTAEDATQVLSFDTDGEPQNGNETDIRIIVKAQYSKFTSPSYEGKFYIQTAEGTAVPITVKALAKAGIYSTEKHRQDESECASLNFVDTIKTGVFTTEFYVESNIRWTLGELPDWVESAATWGEEGTEVTNVLSSGKINPKRQHVSLRVKAEKVSTEGQTGTVSILDMRGETLKKVSVTFAGVGSSFLTYDLTLPSEAPNGNPWGFEAKASMASETDIWKAVSRSFNVTTSANYSSIADAPYHLLLVRADNGIARKEEVHWARLEMGSSTSYSNGLYTKEMVLHVNDRGDADDQKGTTQETYWRHAIALIVPTSVKFDNLWDSNGKLKTAYANDTRLLAQKNNPDAKYEFAFEEIEDGGTMDIPAEGGSMTLKVKKGSFTNCDIIVQSQNAGGSWINASADICKTESNFDTDGNPISVVFSLSKNAPVENPITHIKVKTPRKIRIQISAFISYDEEPRIIATYYINQPCTE